MSTPPGAFAHASQSGVKNEDDLVGLENSLAPNDLTNVKRQGITNPSKVSVSSHGRLNALKKDETLDFMGYLPHTPRPE
jgi:hypothetical protein